MKSTSTTKEDYGQLVIIILYLREYKKRHTHRSSQNGINKVDGVEADNRRAISDIQQRSDEKTMI